MDSLPHFSFEIVHLLAVLSARIDKVFQQCELDPIQVYVLADISTNGKPARTKPVLLRDEMTKKLKRVFGCTDDRLTELLRQLQEARCIDDFSLTRDEKFQVFNTHKGRLRVLSIEKAGLDKVQQWANELARFHRELILPKSKLLLVPNENSYGAVGIAINLFLAGLTPRTSE